MVALTYSEFSVRFAEGTLQVYDRIREPGRLFCVHSEVQGVFLVKEFGTFGYEVTVAVFTSDGRKASSRRSHITTSIPCDTNLSGQKPSFGPGARMVTAEDVEREFGVTINEAQMPSSGYGWVIF